MKRNVPFLAVAAAAAVVLALCGCQSVSPIDQETAEYTGGDLPVPPTPELKAGEMVQVVLDAIPEGDKSSFTDTIGSDGVITLPFLGKVNIGGMTETEASEYLQQQYIERDIYKAPVVKVFTASRFVYVSGRVARPGRYPWSSDLTASRMIEVAGDFDQFASHKVRLQRGNTVPVSVDVAAIRLGRMTDVPLYPGDRIVVLRSW